MTNNRITRLQLGQSGFQPFALSSNFVSNVIVFDDLQRRQTGCHRELVTAESTGMVAWSPCIELFFDAQYGQWQTTAHGFGHHDDVRLNSRMFESKEFTGTREASLNFIEDQQNAVLLCDFTNALQPLSRSRVNPTLALNGFKNNGRRFANAALNVINQIVEVIS